ncbi:unnamed protein product [Sphagnum balticum]
MESVTDRYIGPHFNSATAVTPWRRTHRRRDDPQAGRFNSATVVKSWKSEPAPAPLKVASYFNSATTVKSWKPQLSLGGHLPDVRFNSATTIIDILLLFQIFIIPTNFKYLIFLS